MTAEEYFNKKHKGTSRCFDQMFTKASKERVYNEIEAYHKHRVEAEILPFLNMILNSYKVINKDDDYNKVLHSIVFKADEIKNKLLKQ